MRQCFALAMSLLLLGSYPALAQTHPADHHRGQPHDRSSHPPMDPDLHALIHDLLGTWSGTMTSPDGASTTLNLTAMNDEHGDLTLKPASSQSKAVGAARDVVVDGHTLRWTQALSGKSCTASATVAEGTNHAAETVKGTMVCPEREWNFVLAKTR